MFVLFSSITGERTLPSFRGFRSVTRVQSNLSVPSGEVVDVFSGHEVLCESDLQPPL